MHTLDEIYGKVQALPQVFPLCGGTWEAAYASLGVNDANPTTATTGSGLLHSITLSGQGPPALAWIIVDGVTVGKFRTTSAAVETVILDIRYESEVQVRASVGDADVTVFYRPDPTP